MLNEVVPGATCFCWNRSSNWDHDLDHKLPLFSMFPNDSTGGGPCLMNVVESDVGGYLLG